MNILNHYRYFKQAMAVMRAFMRGDIGEYQCEFQINALRAEFGIKDRDE